MPAPPLPLTRHPAPNQEKLAAKSPVRVFICDDDRDFAEEMASGLATHGFITRIRTEPTAPIDAIRLFHPDIILLDIFMPQPNGFEIIDSLRNDSALKATPLILISGTDTGLLDVATQYCAGHSVRVMEALQKPLRLASVIHACRKVHIHKPGY